ncbi:abscission/NoCut checkpoint regulator [Latimeria chalumnae]|uniref:abscission/NoCut checkpoint regulator n=1 Tax=Latimeria chalumnae TaxID=7897 RepID=UPI00313E66B7
MDRRCYGCASKFSLFKKECGCKNCGRSFCAGCLSQSAVVPRCGNTQQKVCKQCHGELSSGGSQKVASAKWSPPENYKKRVAALEAKQQQQQQRGAQQPSGQKSVPNSVKYRGLAPEDRAIAERLDRLKEETKPKSIPSQKEIESRLAALKDNPSTPVPSLQEMEDRLALLQGRTPPSQAPKPVLRPPGSQTQTEQAGDLFKQMAEEVAVDQGFTPGEESEETGASAEAPLNDLNRGGVDWQNLNRDDDELDGSLRRLEEEKGKLLAEAMVDLKQDNVRQEQILQVAKRLAVLKGQDPDKVTLDAYKLPDGNEENEDDAIKRILQQLSEEVAMDEESGFNIRPEPVKPSQTSDAAKPDSSKPEGKAARGKPTVTVTKGPAKPTVLAAKKADSDDEELPWCCMCNEDATLRCQGCDGDLYCQRCFREGHDEFDRKEHKTRSYQAPRGQK